MDTMETVILMVHTLIALLIIVLVLLQRGKGADAGAAFGAGASGTVFGSRGSSNFFSRATAVLATGFFVSSLALAYLSSQEASTPDSVLERAAPATSQPAPNEAPQERDEPPTLPALPGAAPETQPSEEDPSGELPSLPEQPAEEPPAQPEDDEQR
jgi:preprotein translocase subunit SecG